jgi:CubicO group peptidase (beta-lactamase class C family)
MTRGTLVRLMACATWLAACGDRAAGSGPGSDDPSGGRGVASPDAGLGGVGAPASPDGAAASPDAGSPEAAAPAAYDCAAIQGPLSTNQFYETNPTYTDPVDDSATWTVSTPQAEGLDATKLEHAASTLGGLPSTWSFLVIRHDKLVLERYFHGSARNQSNNVHSASKSIWGAAIGVAIEKGLIASADAQIATLLPAKYVAVMDAPKQPITVRHLITMTSGIAWSEDTTETTIQRAPDWIAAILQLPMAATPGSTFEYSTGNAHTNSAVLTTAVHTTACAFIHENLLAPMGVVAEHWGRDPQGYFSGGYNLYLTPRELAKFGLLYLHGGSWKGQALVPAAWVAASMTPQTDAGAPYSYGYDFWLRQLGGHAVAMAWGFGGQMIFIVPDLDMVVVMTTNTRDFTDDTFDGTDVMDADVLPAAGK